MLDKIFQGPAPTNLKDLDEGLLARGWRLKNEDGRSITSIYARRSREDGISIIRINMQPDYGFYNYAQIAVHHPSPHFQKIQWHGFLGDSERIHVTLTERLHPVPSLPTAKEPLRSRLRAFWDVANYIHPTVDNEGRKLKGESEIIPYDEEKYYSLMTKLGEQAPALADAVSKLLSAKLWLAENDSRFTYPTLDLAPSNIMIRKEGLNETIVMADPFDYDPMHDTISWSQDDYHQKLVNTIKPAEQPLTEILKLPPPAHYKPEGMRFDY